MKPGFSGNLLPVDSEGSNDMGGSSHSLVPVPGGVPVPERGSARWKITVPISEVNAYHQEQRTLWQQFLNELIAESDAIHAQIGLSVSDGVAGAIHRDSTVGRKIMFATGEDVTAQLLVWEAEQQRIRDGVRSNIDKLVA